MNEHDRREILAQNRKHAAQISCYSGKFRNVIMRLEMDGSLSAYRIACEEFSDGFFYFKRQTHQL